MDNNNIILFAIIALSIAFGIHYLFNINNDDSEEHFEQEQINAPYPLLPGKECPVENIEKQGYDYVNKYLIGSDGHCGQFNKVPPRKDYYRQWLSFRDRTNMNSHQEDVVDKIQQLYLDGNWSRAGKYKGMEIKHMYDRATQGPSLYDRTCVRLPHIDNINHDGYYMSKNGVGMNLKRNDWTYENEKIINGGKINKYLTAYDPENNIHHPVF